MLKILKDLEDIGCEISAAGSRITCAPFSENSDHDYLVYAEDEGILSHVIAILSNGAFEREGNSQHYQDCGEGFMSWRKDMLNLIVSKNPDFVAKHKLATALCKRFNLLRKSDRIALFQAILYSNVEGEDGKFIPLIESKIDEALPFY